MFVQALRTVYPQFNEVDNHGDHSHHKQQDAEECYSALLSAFKSALKLPADEQQPGVTDLIDKLFGIELQNTIKNKETEIEPEEVKNERVIRLSCHIDNNNNPISHMAEGLKISLEGDVEKFSETLGRNCLYFKKAQVNSLPSYLTVHFVRFYWKKESAWAGTKAGKAKILRVRPHLITFFDLQNVAFPKVFDIYPFCTEELKKSLDLGRDFERRIREEEDRLRLEGKDVEMKDASNQKEDEKEVARVTALNRKHI